MEIIITYLIETLPIIAIGIFLMYLAKIVHDKHTRFDDEHEIIEKSNTAVGLRRAGIFIAVALAFAGILSTETLDFIYITSAPYSDSLNYIADFVMNSMIALLLLGLATFITHKATMKNIDNNKEAEKNNVAVGIVEFGAYISAGIILFSAFTGEGGGLLSAIVFSIIGQAVLLIAYNLYKKMLGFNIEAEVKKGNLSAGLDVAGKFITFGLILGVSIAGDFTGWYTDLLSFAFFSIFGFILIMILIWIADWIFLPKSTIKEEIKRDKNTAAIILTESVVLAITILIVIII